MDLIEYLMKLIRSACLPGGYEIPRVDLFKLK